MFTMNNGFSVKSLCILEGIYMIDITFYKVTHECVLRKFVSCIEPLIKRLIYYLKLKFPSCSIWSESRSIKLIMELPYFNRGFTIKLSVLIWNLLTQRSSLMPLFSLATPKWNKNFSPGSLDYKLSVFIEFPISNGWLRKLFKNYKKTTEKCWWLFPRWTMSSIQGNKFPWNNGGLWVVTVQTPRGKASIYFVFFFYSTIKWVVYTKLSNN